MSNKIIALSGKQLSGKDCVTKLLLNYLTDFKRIGLGDAIKLEYMENTGVTLEEIEKNKALYRADLIALGNKRRKENEDYWLQKVINQPYNIIVSDMRMKHEFDIFKEANAFMIRVNSTIEARRKRGALSNINDKTETELDNVENWDYIIDNSGTMEELNIEVEKLAEYIKGNL